MQQPPAQTYRIGSKVYQSEAAAEAALTGGKPKKVSGTLAARPGRSGLMINKL
jgi:hypothetical protein